MTDLILGFHVDHNMTLTALTDDDRDKGKAQSEAKARAVEPPAQINGDTNEALRGQGVQFGT